MKLNRFGAMTAVLAGFAFAGCSSAPDSQPAGKGSSSVKFNLRTAEGIVITSVNYDLNSSTGQDVIDGAIPVPDDGSVVNGTIASLLPGSYSLDLSATATYNSQSIACEADAVSFTLEPSQNLVLPTSIALTCTYTTSSADTSGTVSFTADVVANEIVEVERIVETFAVAPISVTGVGDPVAGTCTFPPIGIKIANTNPAISYSWSATPDGTFALNATNTEGTYSSVVPSGGTKELTVTATLGGATASRTVSVVFNPGSCVNTCGDGEVQEENGEQCDDNTSHCVACQIVPTCNDGFLDPPEVCDVPGAEVPGGICAEDCLSIIPDDGGPTELWPACLACIQTNPETAGPQQEACDPVAFPGCIEVEECSVNSGCFAGVPTSCYCGIGVSIDDCVLPNFVPTGPCESVIRAGSTGSTTNLEIAENYYLLGTPTGHANLLLTLAFDQLDPQTCYNACTGTP